MLLVLLLLVQLQQYVVIVSTWQPVEQNSEARVSVTPTDKDF